MNDGVLQSCPACAAPEREFVEAARGFEIVRCTTCRLEYTRNPAVDLSDYARTYGGEGGVLVNPKPYASPAARLALECDALFRPTPQLPVAERWVLGQIEAQVPRNSAVLDLGCGTGRFLSVLSRRSYRGIGIDPAEPVVSALRSLGYDAHVGSMPGLRWDGPTPAVVTLFEVLEHLVDPLAVLEELRTRFPAARVGASVPSPFRAGLKRGRGQTDYPPNHFLRWTPSALQRVFERAGYRVVEIAVPPPAGSELLAGAGALLPLSVLRRLAHRGGVTSNGGPHPGRSGESPGMLRRIVATTALMAHQTWGVFATVAGTPGARLAARQGWSSSSMAVWAVP
jgi:SAM-dependent methyltransferase